MAITEAEDAGLLTPAHSIADTLAGNNVDLAATQTEIIAHSDIVNAAAIPEAQDTGGKLISDQQFEQGRNENTLQMADLQSMLLKLQADHQSLLERFEAAQPAEIVHRRHDRVPTRRRVQVPSTSNDQSENTSIVKPIIEPRLNPQFWERFLEREPEPNQICPIDVLVGDPEHSFSEKALTKRARPSAVENARSSRKHVLEANEDEDAMQELETMKGEYMPEQVRINVFSLQYLLRMIFGERACIPHDHRDRGIIILRPYKNIIKASSLLQEKLHAFAKLIESYENTKKADAKGRLGIMNENQKESTSAINSTTETEPTETVVTRSGIIQNAGVGPPEKQMVNATPESIDLTINAIDDMVVKLDLFCCESCNRSLQKDFKTTKDGKDILKCLADLIDGFLLHVHVGYRERTSTHVTFSHLWHVFQPGDHLVTKADPEVEFKASNMYASLWRVLRVQGGRPEYCKLYGQRYIPPLTHSRGQVTSVQPEAINGVIPFTIDTYILEHDGATIVPVRRRFLILPFAGKRKIADLDVFPLHYASERHSLKALLVERGRKFVEYTTSNKTGYHVNCRGAHLLDKQERLDEQMIIDMELYWGDPAQVGRPIYSIPEPLDGRETMHFCYHEAPCESRALNSFAVTDYFVDQDAMDGHTENRYIFTDYNLRRLKNTVEINDDYDYAICTHQLFGYLLRKRYYRSVHVDSVSKVRRSRAGLSFNQLVLPDETKQMIQSQVQEHFRKKKFETNSGDPGLDLVGGKGLGLTILIHGAPGVGKTATAECVADLMEKSLYPITCGDLGSNLRDVEKSLSHHLYSATRWDCILLLDEADVFMAKRTKEDYVRNAMVSVFLRMLEYYNGVLILTTNRIGTFDEAFKSRIHLSLFYPNFDEDDTVAVFKVFIKRAKKAYPHFDIDAKAIKSFARKHYQESSEDARWNGRQIRNAFHTALAKAEYDARVAIAGLDPTDPDAYSKECNITVKVGKEHFEAVAKTVRLFDDYLEETLGVTHAQRLENEKVRKKKTHVRESKREKADEEKELRRRLEAIKKSKAKAAESDSDDSEDSEDGKHKIRKKTRKEKEQDKATRKRVDSESSSLSSDE